MAGPEDPLAALEVSHTGMVVDDLDRAMSQLTRAVGCRWAGAIPLSDTFATADGPFEVRTRVTFSRDAPVIDLIEAQEGSPWTLAPGVRSALHHLAYWTDELAADCDRLERLGFRREAWATGPGTEQPAGFAYLLDDDGLRVELIDNAIRPADWPVPRRARNTTP